MVDVGSPVPAVTFLRTDGTPATVAELADGDPAVLFFLRHYG